MDKVPDFQKIGRELMKDAQTIAEVEMLNFVLSNFEKQGFTDSGFTPWQKRKDDADPGRAILVKSGGLRDSVKVTHSSQEKVELSATAKHAQIHNEGGTINIPVTKKMRKYFWYMYKSTKQAKWKGMALTKKSHFNVKIPKRQFMGESKQFNEHIEGLFFKAIVERFKNNSN
ncbi:phage virion morphogenesis protein [Gramella lutea]|uniref:Phage virion morphogenesis protein n=1 Tax=Christiangramia lutea TaxID=1607951 RepID=A0A9X1V505_9FLAO|nr:phage virion morphogenesis protein [Christiangramia lutea]MCH4824284.1 phage virion morphogenesis protein [Christiangramia lutea]